MRIDVATGAIEPIALSPRLGISEYSVSDDGEDILVYGQDATHVAGYYLWERSS